MGLKPVATGRLGNWAYQYQCGNRVILTGCYKVRVNSTAGKSTLVTTLDGYGSSDSIKTFSQFLII